MSPASVLLSASLRRTLVLPVRYSASFSQRSQRNRSVRCVKPFVLLSVLCAFVVQSSAQKINRQQVVQRHNITINKIDSLSSLSVGNGNFAFTVDATGMQSFPEAYAKGVPLGTQSVWGWHSFPNTENVKIEQAQKTYDLEGRKISYTVQGKEPEAKKAVEYFRVNQHRLQLGNIGLEIKKKDGTLATANDIKNINQQLDLWTGIITSSFTVENIPVKVITVGHQIQDAVSFKIISPYLVTQKICIRVRIPFPNGQWKDVGNSWNNKESFSSSTQFTPKSGVIAVSFDTTNYMLNLKWNSNAKMENRELNYVTIVPGATKDAFELSCLFNQHRMKEQVPSFTQTSINSITAYKKFWLSGGAVDFSETKDPRAFEIERRAILSQYLTKIQCSSAYPPQETGLTYNSWYGKPHLEMHWWHAVHYAQWGRVELMEKSLDWYFKVADKAFAIAKRQGLEGLRWQKMTDNEGNESPSSVGAFLIWQQPHFIYMAELLYRAKPTKQTLNKYKDLLFATADFMASFPSYNAQTKKYNLGKGVIPAQECFEAVQTFNPTYELAYWSWALQKAQEWRRRLGLAPNTKWQTIIDNLAPLPQLNGVYLATESTPDCYEPNSRYLTDHPAVLGTYSSLPAVHGLDTVVMKNTLDTVWKVWKWNDTWGWDFPLVAMTAARLHLPEKAVDALLMPIKTNTYLVNGHNYQDDRLTIYLPGNGGVLNAVALMCTGGDADKATNIGFPKEWKVKWEGLKKMF
jgi:protein-glucosylgalactosylhydroxylysine glucosidase